MHKRVPWFGEGKEEPQRLCVGSMAEITLMLRKALVVVHVALAQRSAAVCFVGE